MAHLQLKKHNIFYNSNVDICPVSHIAFVEQIWLINKETKMWL